MKHDYKKLVLSDDIFNYIEEIASIIPFKYDIVLEFHCKELSEEEQARVKKIIKNNYGMEIDDIDYDISRVNSKSIIFCLIGLVILIINLITEKYIGPVLSNFICVVWWVAIWETIELQTIEKADLKWKRLNHQQLYDAEVSFIFDKK
jgi:hypothetical protein